MRRWIKGGILWTEEGSQTADLVIGEDGRIESILSREETSSVGEADIVDASGLWVLPGAIDAHVHFRDPGLTEKEDFTSGSQAAAAGGVTTVLDMANTLPPVASLGAFESKVQAIAGRSYVDYGLFATAVKRRAEDDDPVRTVLQLLEAGACGVKFFLGPTTGNIEAPGWGDLYRVGKEVSDRGAVLVFHCEDRDVIEQSEEREEGESSTDPADYATLLDSRPRFGEMLATDGALRLSLATGARVHIAHVALAEAVEAIRWAKAQGGNVTSETCPQYLFLSDEDYSRLGPVMKVLPPIRHVDDQQALWQGLEEGIIDLIATDHAPHEVGYDPQKRPGESVLEGPYGMAGVQTMLPLLLDAALKGRCDVTDVVKWTSSAPARAFGLFPRKGSLVPGADADIALVDPHADWRVDDEWWRGKSRNSAFWNRSGKGLPVKTFLRGQLVYRRGEMVGQPRGQLLK